MRGQQRLPSTGRWCKEGTRGRIGHAGPESTRVVRLARWRQVIPCVLCRRAFQALKFAFEGRSVGCEATARSKLRALLQLLADLESSHAQGADHLESQEAKDIDNVVVRPNVEVGAEVDEVAEAASW